MYVFWSVLLVLAAIFVIFWAGFRWGGEFMARELAAERALSADLVKERNALKLKLDSAIATAKTTIGADVKKIFPWLVMLCAVLLARGVI